MTFDLEWNKVFFFELKYQEEIALNDTEKNPQMKKLCKLKKERINYTIKDRN